MIHRYRGPTAELVAIEPVAALPAVLVMEPTDTALVLGSSNRTDMVVPSTVREASVVRRRSGGGVVFVAPGHQVWIDVALPADHPLVLADVTRSMWWLGEVTAGELGRAWSRTDTAPRLDVAKTAFGDRDWGAVCFASIGHGEVVALPAASSAAERRGENEATRFVKLSGVSQRRTRDVVRLHLAVLLKWEPERWCQWLDLGDADEVIRERLRHSVAAAALDPSVDITERLARAISTRIQAAESGADLAHSAGDGSLS